MRKLTNTLSPSPKGFQSPKFSDSDFREVRGLGLGRPKSSASSPITHQPYTSLLHFHAKLEASRGWEDLGGAGRG
jgi:hypothetical protein